MKLLLFIYSLGSGGAERVMAGLANHWSKKGGGVKGLTLGESTDFYPLHPAVQRISLDLASEGGNALVALWKNIHRVRMIRRVLKQVRPDVALALMPRANMLLAMAARGLPDTAPIGSERVHPAWVTEGTLWEALRRRLYGKLTVVAQTEDAKAWLQRNTGARRVAVIP